MNVYIYCICECNRQHTYSYIMNKQGLFLVSYVIQDFKVTLRNLSVLPFVWWEWGTRRCSLRPLMGNTYVHDGWLPQGDKRLRKRRLYRDCGGDFSIPCCCRPFLFLSHWQTPIATPTYICACITWNITRKQITHIMFCNCGPSLSQLIWCTAHVMALRTTGSPLRLIQMLSDHLYLL